VKVLVAYQSRGGTTRRTALAIAAALKAAGHDATALPMAEAGPAEVAGAEALVVGSWVEGFIVVGVRPARPARRWVEALPPLRGIPAAVFCTYAMHPRGTLRELARALEQRGARVVAERAFHRRRPEAGAGQFVAAALGAIEP
jgi:hypothetical protein